MGGAVKQVVKPFKSKPKPKPAVQPQAEAQVKNPAISETPAKQLSATDKQGVYDSAARRVRRGRAAGYRSLMTDRSTLGGDSSTLG